MELRLLRPVGGSDVVEERRRVAPACWNAVGSIPSVKVNRNEPCPFGQGSWMVGATGIEPARSALRFARAAARRDVFSGGTCVACPRAGYAGSPARARRCATGTGEESPGICLRSATADPPPLTRSHRATELREAPRNRYGGRRVGRGDWNRTSAFRPSLRSGGRAARRVFWGDLCRSPPGSAFAPLRQIRPP